MKQNILHFLTFAFIVSGCSHPSKSIPATPDLLISKITSGDTDSFKAYDFSSLDLREMIKKRPGSAYYIGCRLADLGMEDEAFAFFKETFSRDSDPWKREAGILLAQYHERQGFTSEELSFMKGFHSLYPEDEAVRLLYFKALFASGRDEALLRELSFLSKRSPDELLLQAKAEKRSGSVAWADTFRDLFLSWPAGPIHSRAYEYLQADGDARSAFNRREVAFFRAKQILSQGDASGAAYGFGIAEDKILAYPAVLWDYGAILQRTRKYREGIAKIETLIPRLGSPALVVAEDALGRLHRLAGREEEAFKHQEKALLIADLLDGKDIPVFAGTPITDRVLWNLLDSSRDESFGEREAGFLVKNAGRIRNPEFFSDYFENLSSLLVRKRAWKSLDAIHAAIKGRALPEDSARFAFLDAVAQHAKLYTPPGSGPTLIRSLLEEASAHGTPYYRILAATALGESLPLFDANASSARPVFASATPQDKFVQGFIDFRLPERGLSTAKSRLASLSPETLASLARSEASKGKYIESLRLLHLAVGRENSHPSRTTLETLYPLAYREEMEEVLKDVKVPQPLFYGLIREESYFDATIRSEAGAVGLSQLMPATAAEIARRIGLENPELTDPKVNLLLGSRYLKNLLDSFGSGVFGLAGYNAGSGRVLQWKRQFRDLPEVFFAEALPYEETRNYVRKVLVSAVYYGHLYRNMRPSETVTLVFKDYF